MFIFKDNKVNIFKQDQDNVWDDIIADSKETENNIKNLSIDAAQKLKDGIDMQQVEEGFKNKNTDKIEGAIPFDSYINFMNGISPFLIAAYLYGSKNIKSNGPKEVKDLDYNIDIQHEGTLKWIKESTGDLIKQVSNETKLAVREIIRAAYKQGLGPDVAANHIKNIVGLTSRQSMAVNNYMNKLISDGLKPTDASKKSAVYAKKLIEKRAETIARTELMKAMNKGQMDYIEQTIKRGLLKESNFEKQWWTARDERVCPICGPMHGVKVDPLDEFNTPAGQMMHPPAHINCRCNFFIRKV